MDAIPPEEIAYQTAHYDEDQSPTVIIIGSIFTGIAVVTLIVRLVARRIAKVGFGIDDYLAFLGTLCAVGLNIVGCLIAHFGVGKHLLRVSEDPENFVRIGKSELAFGVFYDWSMAASKLAILALLARVFTLNERWFKISIWFWATWVFLWWIASWFITFLECRPLSSNWGDPYQCQPTFTTTICAALFNIVSDAGILVLPQLYVWRLNIRLAKKLKISTIFLLGVFATAISIARIPLTKGANAGAGLYDSTYTSATGIIFTVLEPATVAICANLPMAPKVFSGIPKASSSFFTSLFSNKRWRKTFSGRSRQSYTNDFVPLEENISAQYKAPFDSTKV